MFKLYSSDQDNKDLRLVSVNIIESRGGKDHRVGCSTMLCLELILDSWLNSVNRLTRFTNLDLNKRKDIFYDLL